MHACSGAQNIFVEGELAFLPEGKGLDLEARTRCSVSASQKFTGHFGHSLVFPGPQFSCPKVIIQSNFLDLEASSSRECPTYRSVKMRLH